MTGPKLTAGQKRMEANEAFCRAFNGYDQAPGTPDHVRAGFVAGQRYRIASGQSGAMTLRAALEAGIEARRAGEGTYRALSSEIAPLPQLGGRNE